MAFERYSAVHIFGAPIESSTQSDALDLVDVMSAYDIKAQEVPVESTDITPYYWRNPNFRYFVAMAHPEGPAVVDLMPRHADSDTYLMKNIGDFAIGIQMPNYRRIEVPTDQETMIIAGPSPRFPDKICVHEFITYID